MDFFVCHIERSKLHNPTQVHEKIFVHSRLISKILFLEYRRSERLEWIKSHNIHIFLIRIEFSIQSTKKLGPRSTNFQWGTIIFSKKTLTECFEEKTILLKWIVNCYKVQMVLVSKLKNVNTFNCSYKPFLYLVKVNYSSSFFRRFWCLLRYHT